MEARGPLGKAPVSTESGVPPQPETDGGQASGGGGAQGGGGASSYSDDPEMELRQIMRSSDFQKFCSLCQGQGQGDVFAICRQHVAQQMVHAHTAGTWTWTWTWYLQGIHAPPVGTYEHGQDTCTCTRT